MAALQAVYVVVDGRRAGLVDRLGGDARLGGGGHALRRRHALALATPLDAPLPLGLGDVRDRLGRWCGAVLMLNALAT